MKVLIIGCGQQGTTIAKFLVKHSKVTEISLAERVIARAEQLADELKIPKVSTHSCDAGKAEEMLELAKGVDIVVNAVIPLFNLQIMKAAFKAGANYVDMASGPPYDNVKKQLAQSSKWKKAGLTALINMGISPGVANILIARAADKLDSVEEIHIRSASKIAPGTKFLDGKEVYIETWSPETAWLDYVEPPVMYENGKWKKVPPFYGEEIYEFPPPCGPANIACHAHEEVYTLPRFIKGVKKVDVKFGWMPTILIAKVFTELGLFDEKPIEIKGAKVAPRDVLFKLLKPVPTEEELIKKIKADALIETVGAFVIEVKGEKAGVKTTYKYYPRPQPHMSLREAYQKYGKSALERNIVGDACAICVDMLGKGKIKTKGVIPCEALSREEREAFLVEFAKAGYVYNEMVERSLA